jgi:hypothetical protein
VAAALSLLGGSAAMPADAAPKEPVDLVLVLAVDVSESINQEEARLQRVGYAEAFADRRVIAAIQGGRHGSIAVAYIEWAGPDEQRTVVGWTRIAGPESARALTATLSQRPASRGYWTSISGAIAYAAALIENAPFRGTRRVIDLSSDGRNNAGAPLPEARGRALARGITINGLPILARRRNFTRPPIPFLDRYFEQCVIGGPGAFFEVAEGFRDFTRAVRRKLVREIAGLPGVRAAAAPAAAAKPDCDKPQPRAEAEPAAHRG